MCLRLHRVAIDGDTDNGPLAVILFKRIRYAIIIIIILLSKQ